MRLYWFEDKLPLHLHYPIIISTRSTILSQPNGLFGFLRQLHQEAPISQTLAQLSSPHVAQLLSQPNGSFSFLQQLRHKYFMPMSHDRCSSQQEQKNDR